MHFIKSLADVTNLMQTNEFIDELQNLPLFSISYKEVFHLLYPKGCFAGRDFYVIFVIFKNIYSKYITQ